MNEELSIKLINYELEKMKQDSHPFFGKNEMITLLSLLSRYDRDFIVSSVANIIDKLDLIIRDLEKLRDLEKFDDEFNDEGNFMYVANFIRKNW
ncbi:hypothetical protein YZ82_01370 [Campylobacter hyointestinalis]|uniref:Uncharacterized protein n=1 Tax=Campylobacter hyointestinalis TaxID=198 RepID=A0A562XLQ4_CAMHY|nr:hypothetical protein [Campylobacter hyointestinalis]TWO22593.1 hypothetical protein YZ82_01370 [Campylobacter hyointestinalis]